MQSNKVADSLAFSLRIATNLITDHYRMRGTDRAEILEPDLACSNPNAEQLAMARQRAHALPAPWNGCHPCGERSSSVGA